MSEFGTPNATDDGIFTSAQWNAALRRLPRELQDMFMFWLYDDLAPPAGAGGTVGGLSVANVAGQMQSTVAPGMAFYYNAALASPLSKFGLVALHTAEPVNHAAADGTYDRIDVISIASPTGTDTNESVMVYESAPESRDTQRGAQPALTVTAGTPGASPSAPATPAGELKLCEVLVPAAASNLDAATYTDSRVYSRGPTNRGEDSIRFHGDGDIEALTGVPVDGGDPGVGVKLDVDNAWLKVGRGNPGSGQSTGDQAVLCTPNEDRTWWHNYPFAAGTDHGYISGAPSDLDWFDIGANGGVPAVIANRLSSTNCSGALYLPIPVPVRGLSVKDMKLRYEVTEVFTGTVNTLAATLLHYAADGTLTELKTGGSALANTISGVQTLTFTITDTVLDDGDQLLVRFNWDIAGGGAGILRLYTASLQFQEGRA